MWKKNEERKKLPACSSESNETDCFERRVIFDSKGRERERERERGISSSSIVLETASNFEWFQFQFNPSSRFREFSITLFRRSTVETQLSDIVDGIESLIMNSLVRSTGGPLRRWNSISTNVLSVYCFRNQYRHSQYISVFWRSCRNTESLSMFLKRLTEDEERLIENLQKFGPLRKRAKIGDSIFE